MKTTFYDLMYDTPVEAYQLSPLSSAEASRIREKTMNRLAQQTPRRSHKPLRAALIAAAAAVLLCGTAFAAYANGWFGFDRLFGQRSALVAGDVTDFDDSVSLTLPTYTDAEQAMIAAGTMQIPAQATLTGGASAETEDFRFTLESMLASKSGLYTIVRAEEKTEATAALFASIASASDASDAPLHEQFSVFAQNNSAEGREKEWKNGAMGWELLTLEDGVGWFVLSNNGGEFARGDSILFRLWYDGQSIDLFEATLPALLDTELICTLSSAAAGGGNCGWDTVTLTPIELRLDGHYAESPDEMQVSEIAVTLRDGTCFDLASPANAFCQTPYGSLGSLSFAGTADAGSIKLSWFFSQLIEPSEVAALTINGTAYLLR